MRRVITPLILLSFVVALLSLPTYSANARPLADTYSNQPDGTTGKDTMLISIAPTSNYETNIVLSVGESNLEARTDRSLVRFDLSSIPSNAVIASVTLSLWVIEDRSSNARDYKLYRVLRNWNEAQATWNIWSTSNNWTTAGVGGNGNDADLTTAWATTNFSASETAGTEKQFSINTTEFTKFVNGTYTNYGWLIKADTETNDGYTLASSDYATASIRPKLVVVYNVPTNTPVNTNTPTNTATPTNTFTPTNTATNTATYTPTSTFTPSSTPTITDTPTNTATNTPGPTATFTETFTPTNTAINTATATPTNTATNTATATVTKTFTPTPSNTPSTPVMPTWYIEPTITYGEYMLDTLLLALCGVVLIVFLTIFIVILIRRKK